jgi:hypothetical protein
VNQSTVQKSRGLFFVFGAAVVLLAALPGRAANLVDVRIGVHDEYTRVVLETDAAATCEIESSGSQELVLRLGAVSGERMVASAGSAHLMSVRVTSADARASRVHIALRGPVDVKKLVLREPDRVVLDLREAPATAAAPEAPAPPVASPEPAAEATPEPAAPPWPGTPAAEETDVREAEAAAPTAIPEPDPGAMVAVEEEVETPAPTPPQRVAVPPPPTAEKGMLDGLPAPLNQPLVLGAVVALVLAFILAFVVMRQRSAAAEEPITPFAAGEPFSVDEQSEVAPQPDEEEADAAAGEAPVVGEASLFDEPVEATEPPQEPQGELPAMVPEEAPEAPPTAEPLPGPGASPELEDRFARLEQRLEEVVDVNDRLSRQVAAQTEELRVQRAAIARTQRVLRDLSRSSEEPTEPVPKS